MKPGFEAFAKAGVPHPCCVPSQQRAFQLQESRRASVERQRITGGSREGMIHLPAGSFLMGTEHVGYPDDGEGPVREVSVDGFFIDAQPVRNWQFQEFIAACSYRTEAEKFGWSFVFRGHIPPERFAELVDQTVRGLSWWCKVNGADWRHPEGPGSSIAGREDYPVVHVSWNDALAWCAWARKRLPTEAEWEYAARGGLEQKLFPWGDELTPGGRHLCNIWQGEFPDHDTGEDGYTAPAPPTAFPPNGYGLYAVSGNTWEWCADWFDASWHLTASAFNPVGPPRGAGKVMKGGSYLCHHSYCNRYRVAARTLNTPDSSTTNIGFRCVSDL